MSRTADIIRRKRGMLAPDSLVADINSTGPLEGPAQPEKMMEMPEMDISPDPADVEQAAAMLQQHEQPRPGSVPAQVAQATMSAAPVDNRDEDELWEAREADRKSRLGAGLELAGRQLVGAISNTPVGQGIGAAPSQVPMVQEAIKSRSAKAAEVLRQKRQGHVDARDDRSAESEEELRRAKIAELLRKSQGGGDGGELASYKAMLLKRYPDPKLVEQINGLTSMKGAQDLQDSLDAEKGRATTIEAARINAGAARTDADRRRAEDRETKTLETEDKQVAELAKASGSDVAMGRKALDEVDAAIAAGGGEAPGTGRIKSMLPDVMLSNEGNKVRQNARDALAIMLSVRSGATVSSEELARTQGIYGINGSSEQFSEGMKRLRRDFEETLRAKQAGYGPKVKEKFVKQGGVLAGGTKTVGGVTYEKRADGKWYPSGGK